MKITLLVVISAIKIGFKLKKSNSLFILCYKFAIIRFIAMRQPSQQTQGFSLAVLRQLSIMLPAYLLGIISVKVKIATEKNSLKCHFD